MLTAMFVALWAWLLTKVFLRRRITVHLRGGGKVHLVREKSLSPKMAYDYWREWQMNAGAPIKLEFTSKRGGGRYITIRREDVAAVEVR